MSLFPVKRKEMKRENNHHRRALEKIAASPGKFGFANVISVSIETTLYSGRRAVAQPDLMIESLGKFMTVVEYKGTENHGALERAKKQLENAVWWLGKYRPDIPPENINTKIISGGDSQYRKLLR